MKKAYLTMFLFSAIFADSQATAAKLETILYEDFDSYPVRANLSGGGLGGWVGRWGGNITVSAEQSVSRPHSAKMDNNLGCWESQLYHPLPYHPVIWFSADIMGKRTGRSGCHNLDVQVQLYTTEGGTWGRSPTGIAIHSGRMAPYTGPGLIVHADSEWTIVEPDYNTLVGQWINVMARLDMYHNKADFWVDGTHRATLAMNPACPLYKGIAIDCGEGMGHVDNIHVFTYDNLFVVKHKPDGFVLQPLEHVEISFSRPIAESTFTAEDVNIVTPSGVIPREQITINPIDANTYRINFPSQSETGEYHVFIGPHIQGLDSDEMDQDIDGICGEALDDSYDGNFTIIPRIDSALRFDGNDRVIIPNKPSLNPSEITAECWVNFGRLAYSGAQFPICKGGDRTSGSYRFAQGGYSPDSYSLAFGIGEYWIPNSTLASVSLETNRWYHLAGTYDGQVINLYLDGTILGLKRIGRVAVGNSSPLYFSYNEAGGFPYYLTGEMDEVRIWNHARTEDEIRSTMHDILTGFEPGLVGYWTFNEPDIDSQTVNDFSWNGNDGFLGSTTQREADDPIRVASTAPLSSLTETHSTESSVVETLSGKQGVLQNGNVIGDLNGTFEFNAFNTLIITTGLWAGKGFSPGKCSLTLEGATYAGDWGGVLVSKPEERRIYLKGSVTGEILATVEGYLTESVPDSNVYDQYEATWKVGRLGNTTTSATLQLKGTFSYHSSSEFPATDLYILQSSVDGTVSGHYAGVLSSVINHVRIADTDNPYSGEGFSIISYVSESGQGEGWTCDKLASSGIVEMKGLFTDPMFGVVTGKLDETTSPRTLFLTTERIDLGLPPMADLEVTTWGPERVSPGQTINLMVEYRNQGLSEASDTLVVAQLPAEVNYVSSTNDGIYRWETHEVIWKLGGLLPRSSGNLATTVTVQWGLPWGTQLAQAVMIDTPGAELDKYLDPEIGILDLSDYLLYQPVTPDPLTFLTPEQLQAELDDPIVADLYAYGVELGYTNTGTAYVLSAGSEPGVMCCLMASTSAAHDMLLLVASRSSTGQTQAILIKSDGIGVEFFDRSGGMKYDEANQVSGWGEWDVAHSLKHWQCIANCIALKLPRWLLALSSLRDLADVLNPILYASDCADCFTKGTVWACNTCNARIYQYLSEYYGLKKIKERLGDYTMVCGAMQCIWECALDPDSHLCTHCHTFYLCVWGANGGWKVHCFSGGVVVEDDFLFLCPEGQKCVTGWQQGCKPIEENADGDTTDVTPAHDPNRKMGPQGNVEAGQKLDYRVEYENEGEGIAFGVYFTDTLNKDVDDSTLKIGPVIDIDTDVQIAPPGIYSPATRTITWFVGQVDPNRGGYADFSVNLKPEAADGTEIINFSTVYFPSVPEATRTNAIVSTVSKVAPSVSVNVLSQDVQYSDPIDEVIFTATSASGDAMHAEVSYSTDGGKTFATKMTSPPMLVPPDDGTIAGGLAFGGDIVQVGTGTWTLAGVADLAPGTHIIRLTVSAGDSVSAYIDTTINVLQEEDVFAIYVGAESVPTPSPSASVATVGLQGVILDMAAVNPALDSDSGNITKASVTFVNRDSGAVIAEGIPIVLLDPGDLTIGIARYEWVVDIGTRNSASFTAGIIVNGYYTRDSSSDNTVVTVSRLWWGHLLRTVGKWSPPAWVVTLARALAQRGG